MQELTLPALVENLPRVLEFVDGNLEGLGLSPADRMQMDVAVEEIFVNIASYAYNPEEGPATVRFETTKSPATVIIRFMDRGVPYDPLAKPDPDLDQPLQKRRRGGLGIYMVKQYMDGIEYEYRDGQNILTLKKTL